MKTTILSKTLKAVAIICLTTSCFFMKAGTGDETLVQANNEIKMQIKFPGLLLPVQQTEKVLVIFTTGEDGKVNFVSAKTKNKELKADIENQFSKLTLKMLKANVAHNILFNFKTI